MVSPNFTEDNVENGMLFITVTLRPDLYGRNARGQFKTSIKHLHMMLQNNLDRYCWVAELTNKGNVHYHIAGKENQQYAKDVIMDVSKCHKILGNTLINREKISERKRTYEYMIKDIDKTHYVINNKKTDELEISGHWEKPVIKKAKTKVLLPVAKAIDNNINLEDSDTWLCTIRP